MNTRRILALATLTTCLVLTSNVRSAEPAPAQSQHARAQWEHLSFTHDLRGDQTNAEVVRTIVSLGKDGWDLVSVTNFTESGTTTKTAYYFKRNLP